MKALTLTQPWATLVAIGAKHIETRSWSTNYRGALAIHAAKGWKREDMEFALDYPCRGELIKAKVETLADLPRGAVVAIAQLTDVKRICDTLSNRLMPWDLYSGVVEEPERAFGDYSDGRFAWLLEDVRPLPEPIYASGALGLWEVVL